MQRNWLPFCSVLLLCTACGDDVSSAGGTESDGSTSDASTSTSTSSTSSSSSSTTDPATTDPSASVGVTTVIPTSSSSTTDDTAESSSSTGEPVPCGNGRDDEGEECDDGNTEDGDQCSSTCTIPFEVLWTETHNGETSGIDGASGVVIDAAGNIYVVGTVSTIANGRDAWLAMYQPDGTQVWETAIDAGLNLSNRAFGIAIHTSGDLILMGNTDLDATETDAWVARVAIATQTVLWEETRDGPDSGGEIENFDSAVAAAIDASGSIVVVGNERAAGERTNIWVRMYDADGGTVWTDTYNGAASENDVARGVVAQNDGSFVVLADTDEGEGGSGWLRSYDAAGAAGLTVSLDEFASGMGATSDGGIAVGGSRSTASGRQITAGRYDSAFTEVWLQDTDLIRGGSFANDAAVSSDDAVFVVGATPVVGEQYNMWIGAIDADGNPIWSDTYNNDEASLGDFAVGAAVAPDGDLVVVGSETVLGQQSNIWIRKYRTL